MTTNLRWAVPLGWTAALVIGAVLPFLVSDYDLLDLTRMLAIAMAVAGLNLLLGHSGQISVGHGAIFGLGGYAAIILVATYGWPWWSAVLLGGAVCLALGLLLGVLGLTMGGANLGLLTIAVAAIFPLLLIRLKPITGGTFGIFMAHSPIEPPAWSGLTEAQFGFLVCLVALALTLLVLRNLVTGRLGRAFAAVRTSALLAAANGVNVNRTKLMAFAVSAAVAGTGGAFYALVAAIAVPDSYLVPFSITLLAASVVGGSRTWAGALVGAATVIYLPKLAETVVGAEFAGNWSQLVYACALVLTLIVAPSGLVGDLSRLARRATGSQGDVPPVRGSHTRRADQGAPDKQMSDLT
ncbi:branched-chain amino acid ABC transporter permease [Nonomuraea sp. 10N515B]|uniref:branched-chain amino acid ABC transporter permease n=1 Tax=Nonomuraea sp. 10N515B TaxID=3457422 RepID=UPI003FCCD5B2